MPTKWRSYIDHWLCDATLPYVTEQASKEHTHTHPFNGPFSGTTQVSRYQKGKTNLVFTEARDSEWQWHQLGHTQVCISLQTDNHASTSPLSFLQARCPSCRPTNSAKALKTSTVTIRRKWFYILKSMTCSFAHMHTLAWHTRAHARLMATEHGTPFPCFGSHMKVTKSYGKKCHEQSFFFTLINICDWCQDMGRSNAIHARSCLVSWCHPQGITLKTSDLTVIFKGKNELSGAQFTKYLITILR